MAFQSQLPAFAAKNVAVIGCSNDDAAKNADFAKCNGFEYPLLCDTALEVATAYGAKHATDAKARRVAFLIDEAGAIAAIWDPAGTADFPAQVLATL